MSNIEQQLRQNLAQVRQRIAAACERVRRDPAGVTLVAVTKYADPEWIAPLVDLGVLDLGENRPQQLIERAGRLPNARWHLIGQLQRNKVRSVLRQATLIHSVDSLRLLQRISDVAGELGLTARVLLQVNVSEEASKQGFTPEELRGDWTACRSLPHVQIDGLMTMAPLEDACADGRPPGAVAAFGKLAVLARGLDGAAFEGGRARLSMGMSADLEAAIEAGADVVRVGGALFEGLRPGATP